jgi:signal transduction histidine kinase
MWDQENITLNWFKTSHLGNRGRLPRARFLPLESHPAEQTNSCLAPVSRSRQFSWQSSAGSTRWKWEQDGTMNALHLEGVENQLRTSRVPDKRPAQPDASARYRRNHGPIVPQLLRARVRVFIELHRKTRELEQLNADLRRISNQLIKAQDAERRRIARELHDSLGQELAALKMILAGIPQQESTEAKDQAANEAGETVDRAIQQVRTMSYLLHPPLLDEVGLLSAVRWYLDGLTKRTGIATSLVVQPFDFPRL